MRTSNQHSRGRLFYLMGPSGAGKDSLLNGCREQKIAGCRPRIAPRHITRQASSGGEDHIALSPDGFGQLLAEGHFALDWQANGRCYGIGIEVDEWLARGELVLVNGSRAHLEKAMERYGEQLIPVLISVGPENQRQRLLARGRETEEEIDDRIARSQRLQARLENRFATVHNDGDLANAIQQLLAVIGNHVPGEAVANG